jgi:hypothetical protein
LASALSMAAWPVLRMEHTTAGPRFLLRVERQMFGGHLARNG